MKGFLTNMLKIKKYFLFNPVFYLLLIIIFFLPFLDGGTSYWSDLLIFLLPLPLFILGLATKTLNFQNLSKKIIFVWLAFLGIILMSTIGSGSRIVSVPVLFHFLAYFLYFALFLLTARENNLKNIMILLLVVSGELIVLSLLSLLPGVAKPIAEMNLFYANYGHSHLADYLLLVIPFLISLFFFAKEKRSLFVWGGLIILYFFCFVLTFSRGAYVILPLVIAFLFFLIKPKEVLKRTLFGLTIVVPVILLIFISLLSYRLPLKNEKLLTSRSWLAKQVIKPDFDANRIDYWQQAWDGFLSKPLFGYGIGTYSLVAIRFQRQESNWSSYAHNFYLQLLAEGGILAFLSFLGLLFFVFQKAWLIIKTKKDPFVLGALGAILASSLHSLLDYDWHFPAIFLTFWLIVANLIWFGEEKKNLWSKPSQIWQMLWRAIIICFSIIVFVFGLTEIWGNYLYLKGDYRGVWWLAPTANNNLRKVVNSSFSQGLSSGEKISNQLVSLASGNPSLNFWIGENYYSLGQLKKAQQFYQKSIELNPLGGWQLYLKLMEINTKLGEAGENDKLLTFLVGQISRTKNFKDFSISFGKTAYLVGLERLKEGDKEGTLFWWDKAGQILPEWSYFHLELASLYQSIGKPEEARKVLQNCLRFKYPKENCLNYLKEGEPVKLESPGTWLPEISAIPQY